MPEQPGDALPGHWGESASEAFLNYGLYFVPEREMQLKLLADLIQGDAPVQLILELCCGEGLLAERLLERYQQATVWGYDGAPEMLGRAQERLKRFGSRFMGKRFNLADPGWRKPVEKVQAVVTSLALHHLDGQRKQHLFEDVHTMLAPGGAFMIADIIAPASSNGWHLAAEQYDEAVRQRALELDGNHSGFEYFQQMQWNLFRYFDPQDIDFPSSIFDQLKWLEAAGFLQVDVYWMRAGHAVFGGWKR